MLENLSSSFPGDLRAIVGQATTTTEIAERDRVMAGTTPVILTLMRRSPGPVILTGESMRGREEAVRTLVVPEISVLVRTEDDINFQKCDFHSCDLFITKRDLGKMF